jgi:hypothetical protein
MLVAIVLVSCNEPSVQKLTDEFEDKQKGLNYLVEVLQENGGELPVFVYDRKSAERTIRKLNLRDSSPYSYHNECDIRFSVYASGFTDVGKEKGYAYLCSVPSILVENVDDYSGSAPWYESHQHLEGNWYIYRLVFP